MSDDNKDKVKHPDTKFDAKYPYNQTYTFESGHTVEFDNTPNKERIRITHKSGTYTEISPDGRRVDVNQGEYHQYNKGGFTLTVDKNGDIKVTGHMRLVAGKDCKFEIAGDMHAAVGGDLIATVKGGGILAIGKDLLARVMGNLAAKVSGTTNIKSDGDATVKTGGAATVVAEGNMALQSGGTMTLDAGGDMTLTAPNIHLNP